GNATLLSLGALPQDVSLTETEVGSAPFAVTLAQPLKWDFTVSPSDTRGDLSLTLTRDDGASTQWPATRSGAEFAVEIAPGQLEPGYYDVTASFPGAQDWTGSVVAVDGAVDQDLTRRFGVDAGLSWYGLAGQTPSMETLRANVEGMKVIGLGSVRDRYRVSDMDVDPTNCSEQKLCVDQVTEAMNDLGGLDVVTVAGGGVPRVNSTTPYDLDEAFAAGQEFAQRMWPQVTAVEVGNEPIYHFFDGYPFQYASALKAFTAGVKSIQPKMRVLTASYSAVATEGYAITGRWGALYDQESLANNIAESFDTRNEHWYPEIPIWKKTGWFDIDKLAGGIPRMDVETKRAVDATGGVDDKAIWVTELGAPLRPTSTNFDLAFEEQEQAAHLVESYASALSGGLDRVFYFYWQTLLEQCPDGVLSTSECPVVWGLTRNAQSDIYQDGRSQVLSPRPALASAAALIRHIQDKEVLKVETSQDPDTIYGTTVYFADGTAVTWDRSKSLESFGPGATAKNMYGRPVAQFAPAPNVWQYYPPYLLSNVTIPSTAKSVSVPGASTPAGKDIAPTGAQFRMGAGGIKINGLEPRPRKTYANPVTTDGDRDSTIGVKVGDVLRLDVQARAGNANEDVSAETVFACQPGPGLAIDTAATGPISGGYRCQFTVVSDVPARQQTFKDGIYTWTVPGYAQATGKWTDKAGTGHEDVVRVGLTYRAAGKFAITGMAYEGQTVTVETDIAGIARYAWHYLDSNAAAPGGSGNTYTVAAGDFEETEGRRVTVLAYDAAGQVIAQDWFRPTHAPLKGWIANADLTSPEAGQVRIAYAWAFDWRTRDASSRMVMTVGALCEDATPAQRYGFASPYVANAAWSVAGESYPQVTGGTYWFNGLTIPVSQRREQAVYLYAVPADWDGSCDGAVQFDGGGKSKSLYLGFAPATPDQASSSAVATNRSGQYANHGASGTEPADWGFQTITATVRDSQGKAVTDAASKLTARASSRDPVPGGAGLFFSNDDVFTCAREPVDGACVDGDYSIDVYSATHLNRRVEVAYADDGTSFLMRNGAAPDELDLPVLFSLAPVSVPHCAVAANPVSSALAGESLSVRASLRDAYGNVPAGGVSVSFAMSGEECAAVFDDGVRQVSVAPSEVGMASVTATSEQAGVCQVSAVVEGQELPGSPVTLTWNAPPAPNDPPVLTAIGAVPFAVTNSETLTWDFAVEPASAPGDVALTATRDDGAASQWHAVKQSGGRFAVAVPAGGLDVGYYEVAATFPDAQPWTGSVVVADGEAVQDVRLGIDARPSWTWNGTDDSAPTQQQAEELAESLKAVGFGSVRDRFQPEDLDTACDQGAAALCQEQVAQTMRDTGGLDVVAVADSGLSRTGTAGSFDLDQAFLAGQKYAQTYSGKAKSVEFSNEPVQTGFFDGYPFEYASALKAFAAGVKSVDPSIRVLAGSYSTAASGVNSTGELSWGLLFEQEALESNTGVFYDSGNEHWYPELKDMDTLLSSATADKRALDADYGVDGKARWLTEIGFNLSAAGNAPVTAAQERLQAAHVVESYAAGLGAGFERVFPFHWQTLLDQCPAEQGATTDSCESVWGLTRNAESDKFQDGRSQSVSPRPAVAAAAAMARHIGGRQVDKVLTNNADCGGGEACGTTVYFSDGRAVTWDSSRTLASFGTGVEVKNMYGRTVQAPAARPSRENPYLLSGVTAPAEAAPAQVPTQPLSGAAPLRVEAAGLEINGKQIEPRQTTNGSDASAVKVRPADTISLRVRARAGNDNRDVSAQTQFECEAGQGIVLDASASKAVPGGYLCQFTAQAPTSIEQIVQDGARRWRVDSFVKATGKWTDTTGQPRADWVRAGLARYAEELALTGKPYVGQTMTAAADLPGVAQYVWRYRDKPGNPVIASGQDNTYTVRQEDIDGESAHAIEVAAVDAQGNVIAETWFRPTQFSVQGWAEPDSFTAEPGKLRVTDVWAFDWADTTEPGRLVFTVGAPCSSATAAQTYGFDSPYPANAARTEVSGVYPLAAGGTYWFADYAIDGIRQSGTQDVYVYVVPNAWQPGDCAAAHRPNGLQTPVSLDFGAPRAGELECSDPAGQAGTVAAAAGPVAGTGRETEGRSCELPAGTGAVTVSASVESTFNEWAQGWLDVRFYDADGTELTANGGVGTAARKQASKMVQLAGLYRYRLGPWMGDFAGLAVSESLVVPPGAVSATVYAVTTSEANTPKAGTLTLTGLDLDRGVVLDPIGESFGAASYPQGFEKTLFGDDEALRWTFETVPATSAGELTFEVKDIDGAIVAKRVATQQAGVAGALHVELNPLETGYYTVEAHFSGTVGEVGTWTSAFVVLPPDMPEVDTRFGIDAQLVWGAGPPEASRRSAAMLAQLGVGSTRDRMSWAEASPSCDASWTEPHGGRVSLVAGELHDLGGIEDVQMFEDSPACARPGNEEEPDAAPNDYAAAYNFGVAYANWAKTGNVRSIEVWNEQNATNFFRGYPWQYASMLKAFTAGVKSVAPGDGQEAVRVLIGASADYPGQFTEEVYLNNVGPYFDVRNQHFYRGNSFSSYEPADLLDFLAADPDDMANPRPGMTGSIAEVEQGAGVADKPGWLTETGWAMNRDDAGSFADGEIDQAQYLVKSYAQGFA
ncbi:MAG: Ig-like domain-containing protein, partial [Bifidobacteriaceae bacterium]|nr:Ig-like domain-containing protein [Bifidobacteriaceae bacterium]